MKINDNVCFDTKIISETFNHVYTTLSSKLIEKLPNVNKFGLSAVRKVYSKKGANINNFSFSLVSKIVVHNHLNSWSVKKATGLDLAEPLAHIIHLSLLQWVVPDDVKSARVVPL